MKANNILDLIGNTPILKLNNTFSEDYEVYIKLEKSNPAGSIKDRIAYSMIHDAENAGIIDKSSILIEPTSGNTGVGLAMVAAVKKLKLILVMPESMSIERRKLMATFGAEFVLTPKEKGMPGAIEKAKEMVAANPKAWMPSQFDNISNINIHRNTTAKEIIQDLPDGVDYLITGVGTGGHITGVAEVLKEKFSHMQAFAVEPIDSPVISGGKPGPHPIQGIGAGFIPENLHMDSIDGTISVTKEDAFMEAKNLALNEGLLAGISTGASIAAIRKKLSSIPKNSRILTFNYDTGERYLSIDGLF
ncbi:MAG: cysteine synthase A [Hyphomicrobiales bacterium]